MTGFSERKELNHNNGCLAYQLQHLLQTSEAIRSDGHPDWFVLTGFLHDVGKVLCLFGEPQWAVVGDTFPVGCSFSKSIVHSEYFSIFATKNFYKPKVKSSLLISFVMKKKIGNAVKRNKIRRKLKAIVQKLLKKRGAIDKDYTYIVFGKSNAYTQKHDLLLSIMEKCFGKIKK